MPLEPLYGPNEPYTSLLCGTWGLTWWQVFLLTFLVYGPATALVAWYRGLFRTRELGTFAIIGYADDRQWLAGHWFFSPAMAAFSVYFWYAVPETLDELQKMGLLQGDVSFANDVFVRYLPLCVVPIALLQAFVFPLNSMIQPPYTWRHATCCSFVAAIFLRLTVFLNHYLAIVTGFNLAYICLRFNTIFSRGTIAILHPDGYGGWGRLWTLYCVLAALAFCCLGYLTLLAIVSPFNSTAQSYSPSTT